MAYKQVPISYTPTSGITLQTGKGLTLSQYTTKQKWSTTKRFSVTPTGSIIGSPTEAHTFTRQAMASQHKTTGPRSVALPGHHVTKTQPKQTGFPVQPLTSFVTHATPSRTTKGTFPIPYTGPRQPTPASHQLVTPTDQTISPTNPGGFSFHTPSASTSTQPVITPYTHSPNTVQAPTPLVVTRTTTATSSTTGTKKWWLIGAVVAVGGGLYLWYRHRKQQGTEAFQ